MPFKFSLGLLIFLSLLTGFLLAVLAAFLTPRGSGGAYAVLSVDESRPDREIRGLLQDETAISEASQWVFLDEFDGLARIPLDEYQNRIKDFDPRNDGYAERVRAFFVRDGKRLFFIPLRQGFGAFGRGSFEKRLSRSLGDIPFETEYLGRRRPVWLYGLLLLGAGVAGIFLSRCFALGFCFPALAGFAFAGASGLALAAVFAGLSGLLLAPCREYVMLLRYRKSGSGSRAYEGRTPGDMLGPFRVCWLLAPLFPAALALIALTGQVHPLLVLAEGAGFAGIFIFSQWVLSQRGDAQGHVRFTPVLIRRVPVKNLAFFRLMLPLALASLLPLPGGPPAFGGTDFILREAEYQAHAAFQASFSYRPLGSGETGEPEYLRYVPGDDGLIAGGSGGLVPAADIPPFPLRDLMGFLETGGGPAPKDWNPFILVTLVPLPVVLLFSLPALIRRLRGDKKQKKRLLYKYKEKGIAA